MPEPHLEAGTAAAAAQLGGDVAGGGLIFSMLTAILGACILLWLVGLVTRRR